MFGESVPVYLITGFLEGGKTQFLRFTMSQDYFMDGSKTLLIVCEDGEEAYSPSELEARNTVMVRCEEASSFTSEWLLELGKKYHPERVLIEYNGMWTVKEMAEMEWPYSWELYQIITILDGSQFKLYLNNMKSLAMELVTYSNMIIFNRCGEDTPLDQFARSIKAVNRQAEIIFENEGGEILQPAGLLPFDVESDVIEIADEDYGIWYIDMQEHPERYKGKTIHMRAMCLISKELPDQMFVPGRHVMTCCADDIRFLGFVCKYRGAANLIKQQWIFLKAKVKWEHSSAYRGEGPVLYAEEVLLTGKPAQEIITL